jgi:hypothetical protein
MKSNRQSSKQEPTHNQGYISSSNYQMAQVIFAMETRRENGRYLTSWQCKDCGARGASGTSCATVDESIVQAKAGLLEHQRIAHTGRRKKERPRPIGQKRPRRK